MVHVKIVINCVLEAVGSERDSGGVCLQILKSRLKMS